MLLPVEDARDLRVLLQTYLSLTFTHTQNRVVQGPKNRNLYHCQAGPSLVPVSAVGITAEGANIRCALVRVQSTKQLSAERVGLSSPGGKRQRRLALV